MLKLLEKALYWLGAEWKTVPVSRVDSTLNRRALVVGPKVTLQGKLLDQKSIQILAGCPGGGLVQVESTPKAVSFTVTHAQYIRKCNSVEIQLAPDGYILYLDYIWFKQGGPSGLGAITLLRMATLAQRLGFKRIELLAAGGSGEKGRNWSESFWGYEYWPRLGFDAPLHYTMRQKLRSHPTLSNATLVSEVVLADLNWWKQHGDGWEMTFELSEGSASWYTLDSYLSSRKGLLL